MCVMGGGVGGREVGGRLRICNSSTSQVPPPPTGLVNPPLSWGLCERRVQRSDCPKDSGFCSEI